MGTETIMGNWTNVDTVIEAPPKRRRSFVEKLWHINEKQCHHLRKKFEEVWNRRRQFLPYTGDEWFRFSHNELLCAQSKAENLMEDCSSDRWLLKAVELGECSEQFVEVLLDLHWSNDVLSVSAQEIHKLDLKTLDSLGAKQLERLDALREAQEILLCSLRGENVDRSVRECREADKHHLITQIRLEVERHNKENVPDDMPERHLALLLKDRHQSEPLWHPPELQKFNFTRSDEDGCRSWWSLVAVKDFILNIRSKNIISWKVKSREFCGGSGVVVEYPWVYGKIFALKRPLNFEKFVTFKEEAKFLAKYRSPYIVGLVGYWEIQQTDSQRKIPFLLMEMLDLDLKELIDKFKTGLKGRKEGFSSLEAVKLMLPIAKAMRFLHGNNVAHRDLKPQNIMCNVKQTDFQDLEDVSVKLIDFGEAKAHVHIMPVDGWERAGTSGYMAPEVHEKKIDLLKADVFSFGMVLGEVLTWKSPLQALGCENMRDFWARLKDGERPRLPDDIPGYMRFIVQSCWDADRNIRPPFEDICWMLKNAKLLLSGIKMYTDEASMFLYVDDDGVERSPLEPMSH